MLNYVAIEYQCSSYNTIKESDNQASEKPELEDDLIGDIEEVSLSERSIDAQGIQLCI